MSLQEMAARALTREPSTPALDFDGRTFTWGELCDVATKVRVVQTTWQRLLENLDRIREPEHLGGWLATTARRETLRRLRLRGREVPTDDEAAFGLVDREPTPEDVAVTHDRDAQLWAAFAQLSQRCRLLLELVVVLRCPYAQIAVALDMRIGSIGPSRARCLGRLRELLAAAGADEPSGR